MSRRYLILTAALLLSFLGGWLFSAQLSGRVSEQDDAPWSLPERAVSPRHDEARFAASFGGLRWHQSTTDERPGTPGGLVSWRLVGVVATGGTAAALLVAGEGSTIRREAEGASLPGGIRVSRIKGTQVTLTDEKNCAITLSMPGHPDAAVLCPL